MKLTINTRLSKMKETFILTGGVSTKVSTWYIELESWGVISMCGIGIRGSFIMLLVSVKFSANIWRSRGRVCAKASNLSQACWKQRKPTEIGVPGGMRTFFCEMAASDGAHDDRPRDGTVMPQDILFDWNRSMLQFHRLLLAMLTHSVVQWSTRTRFTILLCS